VQDYSHKVLAVNTMPDHMHLFFGMRPTQSLSNLMEEVKGHSSKWIDRKGFTPKDFAWQEGYGGFSYSKSQVQSVIKYIQNQELHHKNKTFIQEYKEHLTKFGIEHDDRYLFKPIDYDPE